MKNKRRLFGVLVSAILFAASLGSIFAQPLPNLVVSKITCVPPKGQLSFTVANRSNVPLPKGWFGKSHVLINGATIFDSIDLKSAASTTGGGIEKPGGTSTYLAPYVIASTVNVKVEADLGNYIKESNEGDNTLTASLKPCAALPGKQSITLPKGTKAEKLGAGHFKFLLPDRRTVEVKGYSRANGTFTAIEIINPTPPSKIAGKDGIFQNRKILTEQEASKLPPTDYVKIDDDVTWLPVTLIFTPTELSPQPDPPGKKSNPRLPGLKAGAWSGLTLSRTSCPRLERRGLALANG
ncbi:MAG: hypothetical protein OEW05_00780 [Candidatus Aminicenantes bacterium]|nr:hypothetical protein [Candidatus Aminicenantes bacterium]